MSVKRAHDSNKYKDEEVPERDGDDERRRKQVTFADDLEHIDEQRDRGDVNDESERYMMRHSSPVLYIQR